MLNSMFRWYQDAEICYALLSDYTKPIIEHPGLSACRWFSRGWTLQELIAPRDLSFYNANWEYVARRNDIANPLSMITGIDETILNAQLKRQNTWYRDVREILDRFTVAQRMSWAATRQTTRVEDEAYSLLGIFDINMPMLYGEGRQAFTRLQREIARKCADHSIFVWGSYASDFPRQWLLAPTAKDFTDAGIVTRWTSQFLNSPLELNAHLMRTSLPLIRTGDGVLAVLNCGWKDNSAGPIYLPLRPFGARNVFVLDALDWRDVMYQKRVLLWEYVERHAEVQAVELELDSDAATFSDNLYKQEFMDCSIRVHARPSEGLLI